MLADLKDLQAIKCEGIVSNLFALFIFESFALFLLKNIFLPRPDFTLPLYLHGFFKTYT